mmetsp:Transcript_17706/g.24301  ORF Transcript_17706/g.24301 Transcript_17706/m.24301 type:complete len:496 (-) Transcript_17706:235-1722(-)
MLILKKCVRCIRDAVDGNLHHKFASIASDVEFATDDLVMIVIWVVIQAYPLHNRIFTDLCFCIDFHFNSSSTSELSFNMCHFEVAMDWFLGHDSAEFRATIGDELLQLKDDNPESRLKSEIRCVVDVCKAANMSFVASIQSDDDPVDVSFDGGSRFESPSVHIASIDVRSAELRHWDMDGNVKKEGDKVIDSTVVLIDSDHGSSKPLPVRYICANNDYFAALSSDGTLFTWGQPDCGRLGRSPFVELDSFLPTSKPMKIMELGTNVVLKSMACGRSHMLAVSVTGELFGWGDNRCGQLGIHPTRSRDSNHANPISVNYGVDIHATSDLHILHAASPIALRFASDKKGVQAVSVACGAHHSLCLDTDGVVYSWGRAANGRLGQVGDQSNMSLHQVCSPGVVKSRWLVPAAGNGGMASTKIVSIAAGFDYSLCVGERGAVFTWGCGTYGALGHGSHCDEHLPRLVTALHFPGKLVMELLVISYRPHCISLQAMRSFP